jgi:hypothetical protein
MKLCNLSTKMLFLIAAIFGYISQAYAEDSNTIPTMKILWQKEITADNSLDCSPGPVTIDKTNKKLLIAGTSFRPRVYSEGKFWLIEVDANSGDVTKKTTIKDVNESKATLMLASSLISSMTVSENNDIILAGKFGKSGSSIMKMGQQKNVSECIDFNNNEGKNIQILNSINLRSNDTLFVGRDKRNGSLIIKVDSKGNKLWDKNYRIGQGRSESFTDGLAVGDKGEFVTVGWFVNGKFPDETITDFILRHNAQGDVIAKEFFDGKTPGLESMHQVCQENSGTIVVIYEKSVGLPYSDINIRAYTSDLKFLWEKQVVKSEEAEPSTFNIIAKPKNGFIAAVNVDFGNLRVFEYDGKGNHVANLSRDKDIRMGNIGLVCMDEKAFVVYQTRPNNEKGEEVSKIKIIALELK